MGIGIGKNNRSKHHLVPKSRQGVNDKKNIRVIHEKEHQNLHNLLGNRTPDEQLLYILELNEKVFIKEFKQQIMEVINNFG